MATNAIHGRFGAFYVDQNATPTVTPARGVTKLGNLTSWTLGGTRDTVEVTTLGDTNKNFVSGLSDGTGSIEGVMSTSANGIYTVSDGLERAFYRYNDDTDATSRSPIPTGKGYSYGIATFNGIDIKSGVAEANTFTMNWTLAGNITHL